MIGSYRDRCEAREDGREQGGTGVVQCKDDQ